MMNSGQSAVNTKLDPGSAAYKALVEKRSYWPVTFLVETIKAITNATGADGKLTVAGYVRRRSMREVENARKEGAAAMRISNILGTTERKTKITQWHQAMDPETKCSMGHRQ